MNEEDKKQQESDTQVEVLTRALELEKKRSEECLTRLKYVQADLENMRKRFDRQVEDLKKYNNERIIIELLEVVDELEMAVESSRSSRSAETLVQGVEMTLKKLKKTLANEGVSPVECVGKSFDPSRHNAVAKMEKDGVEGCTVVEEVRKGYVMKEKVIRPSVVKIVVKSSKPRKEMSSNE